MHNFASFLQTWYDVFSDSIDTTSLFTAKIASSFLWHSPADVSSDPASWLTIIAGLFTAVGAILPPAGQIPANGISGILTAGAGAAGFTPSDPPEDVRFTDFSELQAALGKMKQMVQGSLTSYFDTMLATLPPDGDRNKGTELARILEGGAFADQDFGIKKPNNVVRDMTKVIQASVIAEAWNNGHVIIAKWSHTGKMAEFFDPCGRDAARRRGIDHACACQFDNNYVIVRMAPYCPALFPQQPMLTMCTIDPHHC